MPRKLFRMLKVLSLLGAAAAAIKAVRQGATRPEARPSPSVDTWPEVPRRD